MYSPSFINVDGIFYPLGNTPAVCLTQYLPPEDPARILCLGCGDARNVLFTGHCEVNGPASNSRAVDITHCDISRAVIARNILLFTLLLDDAGQDQEQIWNIYYRLALNDESFELLQTHARKLHESSISLEEWHDTIYGSQLRICDQVTLTQIRGVWESYFTKVKETCHSIIKGSSQTLVQNPARIARPNSRAPLRPHGSTSALGEYRQYRGYRMPQYDHAMDPEFNLANPTLAYDFSTRPLCYTTDPFHGFHLVEAYAPLKPTSTTDPKKKENLHLEHLVKTARVQFDSWCESFRRWRQPKPILRFFVGDALNFCHALAQKQQPIGSTDWIYYSSSYGMHPLLLDTEDYVSGNAPLSFNAIDTSNLMDYLGTVNLLVATAPLLDQSPSATLSTESMFNRLQGGQAAADDLLCGSFQTMLILLGLFPVQYWTNATVSPSEPSEIMFHLMRGKDPYRYKEHDRLTWKNFTPSKRNEGLSQIHVRYKAEDLARLLYESFLKMFESETLTPWLKDHGLQTSEYLFDPQYNRASFASFLRYVKKRVDTDWNIVTKLLLSHLGEDKHIVEGGNFAEELLVQMHLHGVHHDPSRLLPELGNGERVRSMLSGWKDVPPVVNVTLKVPTARVLDMFVDRAEDEVIKAPQIVCELYSLSEHSTYGVLQLAYGTATTHGQKDTDEFALDIEEDRRGWVGASPLWVSFVVPSRVFTGCEAQALSVRLRVQYSPQAMRAFLPRLDLELVIYRTKVQNSKNVYVTKCRPNISVPPSARYTLENPMIPSANPEEHVRTSITANMKPKSACLATLTGRVDILSKDLQTLLRNGAMVSTTQVSPCVIKVIIGQSSLHPELHFPVPVLESQQKRRIARTSSYVEVAVPLSKPWSPGHFPLFMYPTLCAGQAPIVWGMPRLNVDTIPILDASRLSEGLWLSALLDKTFSQRERRAWLASMTSFNTSPHLEMRISFKKSMHHMISLVTNREKIRVFCLCNKHIIFKQILVIVANVRLDLTNESIVLDTAVLATTASNAIAVGHFLLDQKERFSVETRTAEDLRVWKSILPAMVERVRDWAHKDDCEYKREGTIPVSFEDMRNPLCSCGNGKFPRQFMNGVPGWNKVARYAVRAAISPSYSVPLVEPQNSPTAQETTNFPQRAVSENILPGEEASGELNRCAKCTVAKTGDGGELLVCARCKLAKYCSKTCQKKDWMVHKRTCKS